MVDPGSDGIAIPSQLINREFAPESVIAQGRHLHLTPVCIGVRTMEDNATYRVVSVGKGVGLYFDSLAHDAFDRKCSRIDLGCYRFDDCPNTPVTSVVSKLVPICHGEARRH